MSAPTSQAMLGNSGEPHSIEHQGRTYRFSRLTRKAMDVFSVRLIKQRRERLAAVYAEDQTVLAQKLRELEREATDGVYEFLEPAVMGTQKLVEETREIDGVQVRGHLTVTEGGALNTRNGQLMLISILAGIDEGDALSLLVARRAEVDHVLRLVMAESFGSPAGDGWRPVEKDEGGEGNALPPASA